VQKDFLTFDLRVVTVCEVMLYNLREHGHPFNLPVPYFSTEAHTKLFIVLFLYEFILVSASISVSSYLLVFSFRPIFCVHFLNVYFCAW